MQWERFGPWPTAWNRFRQWTVAGVWHGVLEELQRAADAVGTLDWDAHLVNRTAVRAHQHATGAIGGQQNEARGRSRGGFSTKIHLQAGGERLGRMSEWRDDHPAR